MPEFLFKIKGKGVSNVYGTETVGWVFPPLFTDKVEAANAKQAKEKICELYEKQFPSRVLRKDLDNNEFLLVVKEIKDDDFHTKSLFDVRNCAHCQKPYKVIEKYQLGNEGGGMAYCCAHCKDEHNSVRSFIEWEVTGKNPPIIYKISNKATGMCYVGKTTQIFTLRWYQHFFNSRGTKFHDAIKQHPVTDWMFEVIEIVKIPEDFKDLQQINDFIFEREMFYINLFDSIKNGYNSVNSKLQLIEEPDNQIEINFEQPIGNP